MQGKRVLHLITLLVINRYEKPFSKNYPSQLAKRSNGQVIIRTQYENQTFYKCKIIHVFYYTDTDM